jgi:hypothetical protein
VASRIGAVRGDVVGIEILERGPSQVIDEVLVELPDDGVVELLLNEVSQVDGVAVEDVRVVELGRCDSATQALEAAVALAALPTDQRLASLCREILHLTGGDWVVAVHPDGESPLVQLGTPPDVEWLLAFLKGSSHLDHRGGVSTGPPDMAWLNLCRCQVSVAVERRNWPFRARERQHLVALGHVVDALGVET